MKKIILTAYVIVSILPVMAWPGSSSNGGPGFSGDQGTGSTGTTNVDTPVDGGILTVTALAIGYGVRQARKRKEEKNNDNGAV
jgi:hypothetical protein